VIISLLSFFNVGRAKGETATLPINIIAYDIIRAAGKSMVQLRERLA
jgi:hypothetical protein